ncbi:hypothetical protein M422DRAFT_258421 [Sphaerobolus stellatus SS14]|uniref:Uncharacterized protein n=1 Tax=Sphaerobolus stellatus (strain SS14) TaxID=990650 RepID=A0A0C9UVC0_SPHS4|nr:hypothetical protein M422DRAFT_258421 [Sphaerobolus stellatus SS14]
MKFNAILNWNPRESHPDTKAKYPFDEAYREAFPDSRHWNSDFSTPYTLYSLAAKPIELKCNCLFYQPSWSHSLQSLPNPFVPTNSAPIFQQDLILRGARSTILTSNGLFMDINVGWWDPATQQFQQDYHNNLDYLEAHDLIIS